MTGRRRWGSRAGSVAVSAALFAALTACGGGGSASSTVCDLRAQASDALRGSGPYAGREGALASDMRKASLPKSANADDVADLRRAQSDAATAIEGVAKVPDGDDDARDHAAGEVERALAEIAENGACVDAATRAAAPGGAGTIASSQAGCPSPARPVAVGTPTPWEVIGRTGPEGPHRDKDVSESKLTITNPNDVPVRTKVIVLLGSPAFSTAGALVEYGVPHEARLRSDGGLDYAVDAAVTVAPGASVEVAARMLTRPSLTVKALYGFADILAPRMDTPCNVPVAGADPITLLGSTASGGCTDPAAGC